MSRYNRAIHQGTGQRLRKIRQTLGYSPTQMAARLGVGLNGYYKNESGETLPSFGTLFQLQKEYGISIDWFLYGKGGMYFQEKQPGKEQPPAAKETKKNTPPENANPEIKDLLQYMAQDPLLRHEVLVYFYKYKESKAD